MQRRNVLKRAGIGLAALGSAALAGCGSDGNDGDDGNDDGNDDGGAQNTPTAVPDMDVSERTLESSVGGLSVVGYRDYFVPGQRHDDIHLAVVPAVENTGDERTNLGDYDYTMTLYDADDADVTPGDPWLDDAVAVDPGETGTVLVQMSFINADADPEDVARYELTIE